MLDVSSEPESFEGTNTTCTIVGCLQKMRCLGLLSQVTRIYDWFVNFNGINRFCLSTRLCNVLQLKAAPTGSYHRIAVWEDFLITFKWFKVIGGGYNVFWLECWFPVCRVNSRWPVLGKLGYVTNKHQEQGDVAPSVESMYFVLARLL